MGFDPLGPLRKDVSRVAKSLGFSGKNRLWVVWYGKAYSFPGTFGWHAYEELLYTDAARFISNILLAKGYTIEAWAIEAPTRYQAIKIAQQQHPEAEVRRLPA